MYFWYHERGIELFKVQRSTMSGARHRPHRGIRVTRAEMEMYGVPEHVGARFSTDRLDLFVSVYEVLEITDHGAVLRLIERLQPASATGPAATDARPRATRRRRKPR